MIPALLLIASFVGAACIAAGLNYFGSFSWRRSIGKHWTERARLLYPIRVSRTLNLFLISACAILGCLAANQGWRDFWPFCGLAAFCGALLGSYPLDHQILPELNFKRWFSQLLVISGSRLLIYGPLLVVAIFLPRHWGWKMGLVILMAALWHLWIVSFGFSVVLRWVGVLKPLPNMAVSVLQECFDKTSITPCNLWLIRTPLMYAAALPVTKGLIFSDGMLNKCNEGELRAICFHELAHLAEGRAVIFKRIAGSFTLFPWVLINPSMGAWGHAGLTLIYMLMALMMVFNRRLNRSLEVRADGLAAGHDATDGEYAKVLEKLYMLNQMPAVMESKNRAHPHLYDRMMAAGVIPDYERPGTPDHVSWTIFPPIAAGIALWYIAFKM
ncbi:MAG: hypothetical protein JWM99_2950 [Verrucomicrobiales bacterium]|nr:hypothetical protein [Verrucomicrobiales bacterium]